MTIFGSAPSEIFEIEQKRAQEIFDDIIYIIDGYVKDYQAGYVTLENLIRDLKPVTAKTPDFPGFPTPDRVLAWAITRATKITPPKRGKGRPKTPPSVEEYALLMVEIYSVAKLKKLAPSQKSKKAVSAFSAASRRLKASGLAVTAEAIKNWHYKSSKHS